MFCFTRPCIRQVPVEVCNATADTKINAKYCKNGTRGKQNVQIQMKKSNDLKREKALIEYADTLKIKE